MIFADASALVAIINREADAPALVRYEVVTSVASGWAKAAGRTRLDPRDFAEATAVLDRLAEKVGARDLPLTPDIARLALDAAARFGEVAGHPARLNLGDCFAYALAKALDAPLLYKGDDFARTDPA